MKKYANIFYYIGVILLTINVFFSRTTFFNINHFIDLLLDVTIIVLFAVKFLFQKYTKKQLCIYVLFGLLVLHTAFICKDYNPLFCYLVVFGSQNINIKKAVKCSFYTMFTFLVIHIVIFMFNLVINLGNIPVLHTAAGLTRYGFYLNHPNIFAGIVLWLTAEYIFINYDKITVSTLTGIGFIYILTYLLTISRTALLASLLFLLFIAFSKIEKFRIIINNIAKWSFGFMAILMAFFVLGYNINNRGLIAKIDGALSYRVSLASTAVHKYGTSLLSHNVNLEEEVEWAYGGQKELLIDSLYTRCYIVYGIIYLVIFEAGFYALMKKYPKSNYGSFILLFSLVAFTERYLMNPIIGFPILFLSKLLFDDGKDKKNAQIEESTQKKREVTLEEQRKIQIDLLNELRRVCDENNIKYFLAGGSLLGAIRHKGYIPWDDDIDINMLKEDYDKFLKIFNEKCNNKMKAVSYKNMDGYYYQFAKVTNLETVLVEKNSRDIPGLGVNIDIFPLYYLPDNNPKALDKIYKKQKFLYSFINMYKTKDIEKATKNKFKLILKKIAIPIIDKLKIYKIALRKIENLTKKYKKTNTVAYIGGRYARKEIMPASYVSDYKYAEFEGEEYKIPIEIEEYLTKHYGNYMELPPENERVNEHENIVYWK